MSSGETKVFRFCAAVAYNSFHEDWRGWNFTIHAARQNQKTLFANDAGFEFRIESRILFLEEFAPLSLWDAKWQELIDWHCDAAFVTRGEKLLNMMRRVAILEDAKLIVMYHSPLQFHARPLRPQALDKWKPYISMAFGNIADYKDWATAWNTAYPNGWIDTSGLADQIKNRMTARTACILADEDWSDGIRLVDDLRMQWGRGATLMTSRLTDNMDAILGGQNGAVCLKSDFFFAFLRPIHAPHAERLMLHFCQKGANFRQIFFGVQNRKSLFTGTWKELGAYTLVSDSWDQTARDFPEAEFLFQSNHRFASDFKSFFGYSPIGVQACAANAAVMLLLAISRSRSVERATINEAIRQFGNATDEDNRLITFYGPVSWKHHNLEGRSPMILQFKKDLKSEVVFPYSTSKVSSRLEPTPRWHDREGKAAECSKEGSLFFLIPILIAVALVVVAGTGCTICWRRNRRAYTLAQLNKARVAENARRVLLDNERAKELPSFNIEMSEREHRPAKGREERRSLSSVSSIDSDG